MILYKYLELFQKSTQIQKLGMQFAKSRDKNCFQKTVTMNKNYQKPLIILRDFGSNNTTFLLLLQLVHATEQWEKTTGEKEQVR